MEPDPILEEIWRVKDALARECGYDVHRMFEQLRRLAAEQQNAGRRVLRSAEELRRYAASESERRHAEAVAFKETSGPSNPGSNWP